MSFIEPRIASVIGLSPSVALLATIVFVVFLFRRDFRERPNVTGALWLPVVWVLLMGSRSAAQWLEVLGFKTLGSTEEGTPLDAGVYSALIIAGLYVLSKRQVNLSEFLRNNGWLVAFLLYCLIAITWSDYPFVAFKHWIKVLGHPVMALVLFTEPDPAEALARLMKRSAYVLVPFSILFIKYYPEWGREFDQWTGLPANNGITQGKNGLGRDCLVLGFFFVWNFLQTYPAAKSRARRDELRLDVVFLVMISWLLWQAHSATSFLSLLTGILVMMLLGLGSVNKRLVGTYALLAIIALVAAELTFGISGRVVDLSGHESTMTGRSQLWGELLAMDTNPVFGVGFESFWMGDRLKTLWETHWWHPDEAHNGYLEIYLNLGLIGLFMLAGWIIATFRKIHLGLLTNFQFGRFRMGLLVAVLLCNWTESAFKGLSLIWFVFFIIALEYPVSEGEPVLQSADTADLEDARELTYLPE